MRKDRSPGRIDRGPFDYLTSPATTLLPMQKISPFLWFNDNAEQAAKFYVSVFKKGKITNVTRYTEGSPAPAGTVMTVEFKLFGEEFVALNGGPAFTFTEAVSFVVHCKTQREVDYYWTKLSSGGGQTSQCGWLKDKFGLSWQIVPTALLELFSGKDRARSTRVMQAMLQMTKLDIKRLKAAARSRD
jgi:predicted 3-demethylubiquinone-9 3-methyltransferase (glyoxalase superfamily)